MKRYFISYYWVNKERPSTFRGISNDILTLDKNQLDGEDIRKIEERLSTKNYPVKIINIQHFLYNENNRKTNFS